MNDYGMCPYLVVVTYFQTDLQIVLQEAIHNRPGLFEVPVMGVTQNCLLRRKTQTCQQSWQGYCHNHQQPPMYLYQIQAITAGIQAGISS